MSRIVEQIAIWREEKWWLSQEYVEAYRRSISPDEVDGCVSAVLQVFDEAWVREDRPHWAYYEVFSRGLNPLNALVALGRNLQSVSDVPGFRTLLESLRSPGDYESAKLELALAALCRDSGFDISLHPSTKNGRVADLMTRLDDEEVFFEVKIVQESDESLALGRFTTRLGVLIDQVMEATGFPVAEFKTRVVLDPRFRKRHAKRMANDPSFFQQIVTEATHAVARNLTNCRIAFTIPEIGSFILASKELLSESTIIGAPIDTEAELRRMLRSRFSSAIRQLHPGHPGIIVFRTHGVLEEMASSAIVQQFLRDKGDIASHLSAIIFLPVRYMLIQRWSAFNGFAVVNPASRFPASSLRVFQTIVKECALIQFNI